jgi:hypothetical protein
MGSAMTTTRIDDYRAFRAEIVQKDFDDFHANDGDIRAAFHCAISLYHLADWVYAAHKAQIDATFTFNANGPQRVTDEKTFANALADITSDFELIRSVANSAKHLVVTSKPRARQQPPHTASHAANTVAKSTGWGTGGWGTSKWGGGPTVILEGDGRPISEIAESVLKMWDALFAQHGW